MNRALPDVEAAVVVRLRDQLAGYTITTTLTAARPAITVEVAGGAPLIETLLDEARIAIIGWADTRAAALAACAAAVGALVTAPTGSDPGWTAAGVLVRRGRTVMRPVFTLDPVALTSRYDATVALACSTI